MHTYTCNSQVQTRFMYRITVLTVSGIFAFKNKHLEHVSDCFSEYRNVLLLCLHKNLKHTFFYSH